MLYTETICPQANNSTLPSAPAGATSDAFARNLTNSLRDPAARAFVRFLELTYPALTKIRFKRHGTKGFRTYVLRVKMSNRAFTASGFSVQNAARNFLSSFNYQSFTN